MGGSLGGYAKFYETEPTQIDDDGTRTWFTGGRNFVIAYSSVTADGRLDRADHPDEYFVFLPGIEATIITTEGERRVGAADRDTVVVVPPGDSSVRAHASGDIWRFFTAEATDLRLYRQELDKDAVVAAPVYFPRPTGGYRVRVYDLAGLGASTRAQVLQTRSLMINVLKPVVERRSVTALSPHSHDDFQQGSVAVRGVFVHHQRRPWGRNKLAWAADDHEVCASPSVAVIQPGDVHTTEEIGTGVSQLVDLFCPPRLDFALTEGMVLNAGEYPLPPAGAVRVGGVVEG